MTRELLQVCLWGGAVALALSLVLTPLMRLVSSKLQLIDQPSHRRFHLLPTPLLGGVAVFAAMILAILIVHPQVDVFKPLTKYKILFLGALIAFLLGLIDDIRSLNPLIKLSGQFFCAFALYSTIGVEYYGSSLTNACITVFWVLGIINALNFMDNINGLASGITVIGSVFFFFLFQQGGATSLYPSLFAMTLAGAALGFWFYNYRRRALIFLGDAGSMFMGYFLAAFGLYAARLDGGDLPPVFFVAAWLILGLMIFDMTLVVVYRKLNHHNVADGGKDHTSHRLVNLGLSERSSVFVLYLVGIALGFAALYYATLGFTKGLYIPVSLAVLGLILGVLLGRAYRYDASEDSEAGESHQSPPDDSNA